MRLIKLSANHSSFRTVNFNETGLTLIIGSKSKSGETYNGVGKSLLIELIHFCLGANKNDAFEAAIPQWEFTLEFSIGERKYKVSRNTSKQSVMYLDDEEVKPQEFNKRIEPLVFSIPSDVKKLSFRSLLPKFLRQGAKQYNDPLETGEHSDYEKLIRNAFLLGLDVHLIAKKNELRSEQSRIRTLRENFKKDTLLKDFYSGGKDTAIYLGYLDEQIRKLENDKAKFIVAENYYELQLQADELAKKIADTKNKLFLIKNAIRNIDNSMKEQPDITLSKIRSLYRELTGVFRSDALKQLEEVQAFHNQLLRNRLARLSREKLSLLEQSNRLEYEVRYEQVELDRQLRILGESRALDQYTAVVNQIATLSNEAERLRDYQNIERQYSDKEAGLKADLSNEVIKTNAYLDETQELREKNTGLFKQFVAKFYPKKIAGISISNNDGENLLRFNIDIHIEHDSSDGINEVRIFCYDMMVLTLRQNHKMGFIFHDSRLYANMDVRQRATLFRLAHEVTSSLGLQYIATLNPDFISGMENEFTPEELQTIIYDNVTLTLEDNSAEGKLLGIQVDMHYEQR